MLFVLQRLWPCPRLASRLPGVLKSLESGALTKLPSCARPCVTGCSFAATLKIHNHVQRPQVKLQSTFLRASMSTNPLCESNAKTTTIKPRSVVSSLWSWRNRLTTFENFVYESDIDAPPSQGRRLVDIDQHRTDPALWMELLQFRRRISGLEGILPLWNRLKDSKLAFGISVLRCGMLELGYQRPEILEEVFRYAEDTYQKTGFNRWPWLYSEVVGHFLHAEPSLAYHWHTRLKNSFAPSESEFKSMFHSINGNDEQALRVFKKLYKDFQSYQMYDVIIPSLCNQKLYKVAHSWHKILVANGDFPSTYSYAEPLLHELALHGREKSLLWCTQTLVDGGVSFAGSIHCTSKPDTFHSREMMNKFHGKFFGIAPKTFSDEFCAKLFATSLFSVETVIKGLQILGIGAIGPMAFREIVLRASIDGVCRSENVIQHIKELSCGGISIGESVLSRLIQKLAVERKSQTLTDVVNCDLHPEAFEDWKLQESLLASYQAAGDQRQVSRTLAILLLDTKAKQHTNSVHWNLLLRTCLTRKHWKGMFQILEIMREQNFTLSSKSCAYLRACVLTPRQISKAPSTTTELHVIINVMQWTMCTGGHIPPKAWVEILRRLGMTGQLVEYEKLALWLARWYTDVNFRASHLNANPDTIRNDRTETRLAALSLRSPLHPCRIIFSKAAIQAVIAWGFQYSLDMKWYSKLTPGERATIDTSNRAPWTWGLHLLNKLKFHRVWIDGQIVTSSCATRLKIAFGLGFSNRLRNRRVQRLCRGDDLNAYVGVMQRICGQDLFTSPRSRGLSFRPRSLKLRLPKERTTEKAISDDGSSKHSLQDMDKPEEAQVSKLRQYVFQELTR